MKLEGKSIVVTGASAGMGQAIVTLLAQEGANIIAVARRKERLEALAEVLKDAPGKVVPYAGDVSDPAVCEGMIDAAVKEFGRLDVLVNNAPPLFLGLNECTYEQFQQSMAIGVTAPFYLSKLFAPYFAPGASIINISSSRDRMSQPLGVFIQPS